MTEYFTAKFVDHSGGNSSSAIATDPLPIETKKLYDYALDNWPSLNVIQVSDTIFIERK